MNRPAPSADAEPPGGDTTAEDDAVADAADRLYGVPPEEFVPERDELVAAAREAGDKDAAKAIGHLRRPTQAAWLANLLARERGEQLDGLLDLADELAGAQRSLDGPALRALSSQRQKLVGAMAREARRLAAADGHRVTESVERDLRGILDAALADPAVADEVRSGRLTRTMSYSGFGPELGSVDRAAGGSRRPSAPRRTSTGGRADTDRAASSDATATREDDAPATEPDAARSEREAAAERERVERERRERERRAREREAAEQAVAAARRAADETTDRNEADRSTLDAAETARSEAERRVDELTAELDRARDARSESSAAVKDATRAERESARAARDAGVALERLEARLAELQD
jgi:hypothetical protein